MPVPESTARLARRAGLSGHLLGMLDRLSGQHRVWVVGGAVEAWLTGRSTADVDIVTSAPEAWLRDAGFVPIGGQHGTLALRRGPQRLEATPLDCPLEDNLLDRDFTAWAIALPWPGGAAVDPGGGLTDRQQRLLRTPRHPANTLTRDPVRILRALRRRAEGYRLSADLAAAIGQHVSQLNQEPPERIGGEWLKLLEAPAPGTALRLAAAWPELIGILTTIDPALLHRCAPGHSLSIWAHTGRLVQALPPGALRIAAFFHDLTRASGPAHAARSAALADTILRRWACPKQLRQRAVRIVAQHSFHIPSLLSDRSALRRWIASNEELLPDLMTFRMADRAVAGRLDRDTRQTLALFTQVVARESNLPWPRSPVELDLDAAELFATTNCPPPLRARLLESLWQWTLLAPAARNHRECLHHRARQLLSEIQRAGAQ